MSKIWGLGDQTYRQTDFLRLPSSHQAKVEAALQAIPGTAHTTSLHKWRNLLGLLRSITPAVAGSRGMFTRVQHALTRSDRSHIHLTADVHNNLEAFHNLFRSVTSHPIHLRKLHNFPLTWMGTTGASGSGMGGGM